MSIRSENQPKEPKDRILFAIDTPSITEAIVLVYDLRPYVGGFKIGLELIMVILTTLITADNNAATEHLQRVRYLFKLLGETRWFLDGKFHDIPNTVGGAVKAIAQINPWMLNLHASAGPEAIRKAVENANGSIVAGVTVLTSHSPAECELIFGSHPKAKVTTFAETLYDNGAGAIICSPQEGELLRSWSIFDDMLLVTPGCRPKWASTDDQSRTMTPAEGIQAGIDYFVIGRPIRKPPPEIGTPIEAAKRIADEIGSVM